MNDANHKLRIDKWLWAARFFKTRSLAVDAVETGKVLLDGVRVKPAKTIAAGEHLDIRFGQMRVEVEVLALSDKRGSAPTAQQLYRESDASIARRAVLAEQLKAQPQPFTIKGRPTKRDRRDLERFKQNEA